MMWNFDAFLQNVAVIDEFGQQLTYTQLKDEGSMLCEAVGGRCLVFCLCRNVMGSLLGYVSFINGGIVPLMLNADTDPAMISELDSKYHPAFYWAPDDLTVADAECIYERFGYRLLRTKYGTETGLYPELALLLTTSGSTGSPKFVRQSYANIRANTESIVQYLELDENEKPITTLPMNYTYGLSIINSHLWVGATILLTSAGIAQRSFWDFFKSQGATSFGGVPYTYEMLDRMRFTRMKLPTLRTMTQAGGKLLPQLHRVFAEWSEQNGVHFVVMYGQCEATARMAYLPWQRSLEKTGCMGIAIPGGKFELIGTDGQVITQTGVTGELRYSGANVTLGYAECAADLLKGDERGGILETGDMAQMDEDGYFSIVGRKKRFLKMFGNRVNLDETERMLKAAFPEQDCACGGRDDLLVIFGTEADLLSKMRAYLSEHTGLNLAGFRTVLLDAIPKNDAGKTLYRELEKYVNEC